MAYYNDVTGEVVIVNRGTQLGAGASTALKNLFSDAQLGLRQVSRAQTDAVGFAEQVATLVAGLVNKGKLVYTDLIEAGHSLGGTEAQDGLIALSSG